MGQGRSAEYYSGTTAQESWRRFPRVRAVQFSAEHRSVVSHADVGPRRTTAESAGGGCENMRNNKLSETLWSYR